MVLKRIEQVGEAFDVVLTETDIEELEELYEPLEVVAM